MTRGLLIAGLLAAAGCRVSAPYLLLTVEADASLGPIDHLHVDVTLAGRTGAVDPRPTSLALPTTLTLELPPGSTGPVEIGVTGLATDGSAVAQASGQVTVRGNGVYPVTIRLGGQGDDLGVGTDGSDGGISPATALILLAGQPGGSGGADGIGTLALFNLPSGLAATSDQVYVADTGNHTIRRYEVASGAVTTLAGFPGAMGSSDGSGAAARFNGPRGLAVDGNGVLYVADTSSHLLRRIDVTSGAVTTLAGAPNAAGTADGTGGSARFRSPVGLAVDAAQLYVADSGNHTVRRIDLASSAVTTIAGAATVAGTSDGVGPAARFDTPTGLTVIAGHVYVADTGGCTIRDLDLATAQVTTLAGGPGLPGSSDGTGSAARFNAPSAVAADGAGGLLIADRGNQVLRRVDLATAAVTTVVGTAGVNGVIDGAGTGARLSGPSALAGANGLVYVADSGNHLVRRLTVASNRLDTVAGTGFIGSTNGGNFGARLYQPRGIAYDGAGHLFITTGANTIQGVDVGGTVAVFAGAYGQAGTTDGVGAAARFDSPRGITYDGVGTLYVADGNNHTLRAVTVPAATVTTVVGQAHTAGNVDAVGTQARLNLPHFVVYDSGVLYVSEGGNNNLRKVVLSTMAVSKLAGNDAPGYADGTGATASFKNPDGLALEGGNLYVVDRGNFLVRKVAPSTGAVSTLCGTAGISGTVDGVGTAARFTDPIGLMGDGAGNLLLSEAGNYLREIILSSATVTTLAGTGTAGSHNGVGALASMNGPIGMVRVGNDVWFADSTSSEIRRFDATTRVTTGFGSDNNAGVVDGLGPASQLHDPRGMAVRSGVLYLAESSGQVVRSVSSEGKVTTIAGSGDVAGTQDGQGTTAHFNSPADVAIDASGVIYVADSQNHEIRSIAAGGMVTTLAGKTTAGSADGTGTAASFNLPRGLELVGSTLYVADSGNHLIRAVSLPGGVVTTLSGGAAGTTDGPLAAARFRNPRQIAGDGQGNLYVADQGNNTIRRIDLNAGQVTTIAGAPGAADYVDGAIGIARFASPYDVAVGPDHKIYVADYDNHAVRSIDVALAEVTTVVGTRGQVGVRRGALPAALNRPSGLVFLGGSLVIADEAENVLMMIR